MKKLTTSVLVAVLSSSFAIVNAQTRDTANTAKEIQEVVLTGVGRATDKRKVAIDVATLNTKDAAKSASQSVEQALIGKIAGAQIQTSTGEPGAGAQIILRGINTLGSSRPMFLLDGIEISDISQLDMSNVERVEVVKGAAAGMLYGAQGANGVIQIFTKKGIRGKEYPTVTFSSKAMIDDIVSRNNIIATKHHYETNANGFITDANGAPIKMNSYGEWTEPNFPVYTIDVLNNKEFKEKTYNHLDQAFRKSVSFNNSFNVNGAINKFDYNISASILNQNSIVSNSLNRKNFSFNLGTELFKNFMLRVGTQTIFQKEDLLSGDRFPLMNSYQWIDFLYKDQNGFYTMRPKSLNEKNIFSERQWRERGSNQTKVIPNVNLNYKINKFIELDYKFGAEFNYTNLDDFYKNQTGYTTFLKKELYNTTFWGNSELGSISKETRKYQLYNSLASAFFRFDFAEDLGINIPVKSTTQVSYDWRKDIYGSVYSQGTGFAAFPPFTLSTAATKTASEYNSSFVTFGILLNQNFEFGDFAGLSLGLRSDRSSEFGQNGESQNFPSVRGFIRPTEFFDSGIISEWKLRGAYGEAGIQPDRFARQSTFATSTIGNLPAIYNQNIARNPNLKVQRSKELELGTDVTFGKGSSTWFGRAMFSGSYWQRKGLDIIQNADLSPSGGFTQQVNNLMSLKSSGIEASLNVDMYKSESFDWKSGLIFSKSATWVVDTFNGLAQSYGSNGLFQLEPGKKLGIMFGQTALKSIDQKKIDGTNYINPADAGKYEVVNGKVVEIATGKVMITAANDKSVLGDTTPIFTMSFNNSFTFARDWNLSFQWDLSYGAKIYNLTNQWLYRDRLSADFDKEVTIAGKPGAYVNYHFSQYNSIQPIDTFVEDGTYLRLRDITLSYDARRFFAGSNFINNLSLFVSGRNMLTFTKYSGLDPEGAFAGSGSAAAYRGIDYFGFPNLKSIHAGVTFGF